MKIAFIGGIHGVGKSTVCKVICEKADLKYISASEVLKWKEINDSDNSNKKVTNISYTQDRLLIGLKSIIDDENKYLLDGHYCLLNTEGIIEKVPIETFIEINPFSLNLIIDDVSAIKERLEQRDNKPYDKNLLAEMQEMETFHAKQLSDILQVQLNICTTKDISSIINALK